MKPLAPNTLLQDRYLIVQLIGKGGMGEVYLAVDQRLGSAVALKRTFFSDDETLGNAFEREARTLARLRHPVLPKVSDHFTENGTQYLAMEHISGDDLSKRLEITNKPFPLSWVLFWSDQLLDALAYLHSYDPPIIHRDIKPQNLKLTDENHIVLLDFGLAKNSIGNTRVTSTGGSLVGYTPHYAPMEQIRGTGTGPRSDLYSLSATVYQLLTNTVPPDALTRADMIVNGLPDPTKSVNAVNADIPKPISDVISKGMSLRMEQRYTDAREMQKALRDAYAGMQNAMSAQTIAFNATDAPQNQSPSVTPQNAQPKTGALPSSAQPNNYIPATPNNASAPHNDFDATMRDGEQSFGMKTEVMPFEKLPRAENYTSPSKPKDDFELEDFSAPPEKGFDPGATVPLINFGEESTAPTPVGKSNFGANSGGNYTSSETFSGQTYAPSETYSKTENHPPTREISPRVEENYVPTSIKPAAPKKSGGKALAIVGILGALAVIVLGAAGVGWYIVNSNAKPIATPTPMVQSTVAPTVEPTIEPTVEPTIEANTNTNSSADIVTTDANTVDNTNAKKSDVSTGDLRPQNERPVQNIPPRPTPRVVTSTTNPPHQTTPVRTNPTQTKPPVKSDRTDILQ